ncbi:hypothetical protein LZ30DRAFT_774534 [Colletotrichum cereale]|nr:hypothetical protein LZ30DRAFT_774534 [Colletotrichum cereale]
MRLRVPKLRAVDPTATRQESPWLEVEALELRHVLLHANDRRTYTGVSIRSLRLGTVNCKVVHGVHLREGLQSYHVNGYLVRMNYLEITIKTIAGALRQILPVEQLCILRHLEELQPLLSRFGQGTVMDLLCAELGRSDHELSAIRTCLSSVPKVLALYLQSCSFTLTANTSDQERLGDYGALPNVDSRPSIPSLGCRLSVSGEEMGAGGEQAFYSASAEAAGNQFYERDEEDNDEDEITVEEMGLVWMIVVIPDTSVLEERVKNAEKINGLESNAAS